MKRVVSHKNNREGWKIRFTDPLTGGRKKKTYWYKDKDQARSAHTRFLESRQALRDGMPVSDWSIPYPKLCELFLGGVQCSEMRRGDLKRWLDRNEFEIRTGKDLLTLAPLEERAKKLVAKLGTKYVHKCAQAALKQMTRWAARAQVLPKDPLLYWARVKPGERPKPRAFTAPEFRAILDAAEELAGLRGERGSYRLAWLALLLTGNRPGAVFGAQVKHLVQTQRGDWHIDLPPGNAIKRNGAAMISPELAQQLKASIAERKAKPNDPLLVSPTGEGIDRNNAKRTFERCMAYAFVKQLWPAEVKQEGAGVEPYDVMTLLVTERHRGFDGPMPKKLAKMRARKLRIELTESITAKIETEWLALMAGRYMYRTRATHISWARAANVNHDSIHMQVGHSAGSIEEKHYIDLVNPVKSMAAVWAKLQEPEDEETPLRKAVGSEGFDGRGPEQGPLIQSSTTDNNPPGASGRGQNAYENTVITGQAAFSARSQTGHHTHEVTGSIPVAPTISTASPTRGLGKLPKKDKGTKTPDGARTGAANSGEFDRSDPSPLEVTSRLADLPPNFPPELMDLVANWADLPAHVRETILLLGKTHRD